MRACEQLLSRLLVLATPVLHASHAQSTGTLAQPALTITASACTSAAVFGNGRGLCAALQSSDQAPRAQAPGSAYLPVGPFERFTMTQLCCAVCDPADEVRQVPNDSGPFFKWIEAGAGGFDRNRADSFYTTGSGDDAFAACVTVCRLSQSPFPDPLECIGFALDEEDVGGEARTVCTLLYNDMEQLVTEFVPTAETRVFTLDDCPTSTELGQM